jgi:4-amino-4-deoxy-L-arabinose transferase-like glycosyltransferase
MNRIHFYFLLTAVVVVYVIGMIQIPLMDIDAAQYASISREMLESKNFLQVVDLGRDHETIMLFWISAFSMKIFGVT